MTHKFEPEKYETTNEVAYQLATTEIRMRKRRAKIAEIEAENKLDEHRITQLDRWMLAIFEASECQCVQVAVDYQNYVLTPGDGVVLIHALEYPNVLTMTPYPIEPDGDVEFDDDFVPKMHPRGVVSCNGHHVDGDQCTS